MKKTLAAALAAALTIGAASTTFAAANPFSDVPRDHWAYDAVTQLAADGVVEGYGDGTFRGDRNITRYEMAQMVAKAMAKGDMSASDRALVDRLAAEFADELNNLGVRVSNLERNADMVKWNGLLRYTYSSTRTDTSATKTTKKNMNRLRFRLHPTAEVNKNWSVKARLQADIQLDKDTSSDVALKWAYANGTYDNFNVQLGKFSVFSDVDQGLVMDDDMSGAQVQFGSTVKAKLFAGRISDFAVDVAANPPKPAYYDVAANYQGIELTGMAGALSLGAGYHHLNSEYFTNAYGKKNASIWSVGAGYNFGNDVKLFGAYAKNTEAKDLSSKQDQAYNIELSYKGAKKSDPGSWGLFVGYRHLGQYASLIPTYDAAMQGYKGWEAGLSYGFAKNVTGKLNYFHGKSIADKDLKGKKLFAQVDFSF